MTIGVILPVYDGERYLRDAIDSVLADDSPQRELIVVDDGSTDGTPEVLASYGSRIRVIRQPHGGHAAALNAGLRALDHDLVAFQDADDLWTPGRLALMNAALEAHPDADAVAGLTQQFVTPELSRAEAAEVRVDEVPQPSMLLTSMLIRRWVLDRVGPFDVGVTHGANIDWMSRARLAGMRATLLREIVHRRRVHRSNMGRADPRGDLVRIMAAHLRRHRAAGIEPAGPAGRE
jgi:glycosyltransferase involved in cell wall biosynthesis